MYSNIVEIKNIREMFFIEDVKKSRKKIILIVVLLILIFSASGALITWLIGPQVPKELSFETIVTLIYLSTNFSPTVALAYLWYSIQPSSSFLWGFLMVTTIMIIVAIIVLVALFYIVLPYVLSEELKSSQKQMRGGIVLMFLGSLLAIVINVFDLIPSTNIIDILMPNVVDFWFVLLSFIASIIIFSLSIALGYQKLLGRSNIVLILVIILGIVVMLNYSSPENAFIGGILAIIGAIVYKVGHRKL
ncbi:MAG: hypothetical protein ACUVXA_12990 [Candidatus Jordarchaeum sp.]|uniref:hypothetical protein n=1 Tax=Candidatus Jordarchaeum sp. TaxID=2823881 RepID=UPI0040494B0A